MQMIPVNQRARCSALILFLNCGVAFAQTWGETLEPTPEELDAAFTAQDAAREAAMFSDEIIDRTPVDPITAATEAADLVVRARVTKEVVRYDEKDIPFTHTTLAVNEVIAGQAPAAELTIVQEGGPSRTDPELVYMVSDSHYFDPGDEEVLFLRVLTDSSTPGSGRVEVQERFSVLDGRVYTDTGRGLILTPTADGEGSSLRLSADRHPDPRFRKIRIGEHTFTRHYGGGGNQHDADSGQTSERSASASTPSYRNSADVDAFAAAISK